MQESKLYEMKNYIQHGTTTTYDHCIQVAKTCKKLNQTLHLHANEDNLIQGALLHDFFLYDWHELKLKDLHGLRHAETARKNAKKYYHINPEVEHIIASHMFPLNITKYPKTREAWIVCLVDKYVAIKETLYEWYRY